MRGLPIAPVRAHLERLIADSGAGPTQIARASGVSERTVRYVLEATPDRRLYRRTAWRLMSLRRLEVSPTGSVPGFSASRRLEALMSIGWTKEQVASRAGLTASTLAPSNLGSCAPATVEKVRRAYEQLREQIPPENHVTARTRAAARRAGYAPPWAWPRGSIDDASASPRWQEIGDPRWREACWRRLKQKSPAASTVK